MRKSLRGLLGMALCAGAGLDARAASVPSAASTHTAPDSVPAAPSDHGATAPVPAVAPPHMSVIPMTRAAGGLPPTKPDVAGQMEVIPMTRAARGLPADTPDVADHEPGNEGNVKGTDGNP